MRDRVAVILLCFGTILGVSRGAAAEKVKTNQAAKLFSRPGEQAPVILEIAEGQAMTVVSRDGRWIKVRVKGRTGYVPRSKVDEPEGEQTVRNTRRRAFVDGRGTDRGFNGGAGPDDRVGADAVGDGSTPPEPAKPTKGNGGKPAAGDDDGDDDDGGKTKPTKTPPKPPAKPTKGNGGKPAVSDDDGDDDDGGKTKPTKAGTKPPAKPAKGSGGKPAASDDDGDDDDGGKTKPTKAATKPTKPPPAPPKKPPPKSTGDDDDGDDDGGKSGKDDRDGKDGKDGKGGKGNTADSDDDNDKPDKRPIGHVRENTTVHDDPKASSGEAFVARPKDKLFVGEVTGNFTYVETDEGDSGYVLTSKLSVSAPTITRRQLNLDARLGATIIGQTERGKGSTDTTHDNISLSSTTATISLGGEFLYPLKGRVILGLEGGYDYGRSLVSLGHTGGKTPFTLHEIALRAEAGFDFQNRRGVLLYLRLGIHDEIFHVDDVSNLTTKNTALVPSEMYFAPTVGAMLDVRHLSNHLALKAHLDGVIFGSVISQTKNLEDGATPTGQSVYFGATLSYRTHLFDLQLAYELNYALFDFGTPLGDSQRAHTAADTDTTRTDVYHTITVGVAKQF